MSIHKGLIATAIATSSLLAFAMSASAATLRITIDNLAPTNGTFLTPVWFGLHDGNFDSYNRGEAVTAGLESLAEDGDVALISAELLAAGHGSVQGGSLGDSRYSRPD